LVVERKACQACEGLLNPSMIDGGVYDCDHIGAWTRWAGNLDAEVIIVGQDFSELDFFRSHQGHPSTGANISSTNRNLIRLIQEGLGFDIAPYEIGRETKSPLFFTNSVLCIKPGKASDPLKQSWANQCCKKFLKPLVETIIRPKAVITLSTTAYKGVKSAFGIKASNALRDVVGSEEGISLNGSCVLFPMYHCGGLGLVNRKFSSQLEDWEKVGRFLRKGRQ